MANLNFDTAAKEIAANGTEGQGAVMFKGWLGPIGQQPANPNPQDARQVTEPRIRFFTDQQFLDWLEISTNDILYQVAAAADDPEGGSVIWVHREARIRRVEAGRAYWFARRTEALGDDPTARWPNPPH